MSRNPLRIALIFTVGAVFLASCMPGPNPVATSQADPAAGFWLGLWHGFILWASWFVSLFSSNVNVYEVRNSGGWYNFGFFLGTGGLVGLVRGFISGMTSAPENVQASRKST